MTPTVSLFVPGVPAPQGSKRHVGNGRMVESSAALKPWRATITAACHEAEVAGLRLDCPLRVTLAFRLPRPAGHYGKRGLLPSAPAYPTSKPDVDKLARAVLDALATDANVIADDARVMRLVAIKTYHEQPGVNIHIMEAMPE